MPFSLKKTKLSRLVADHLHSPKHGGALVVETGFPTSLIDLIVKNRDRLRRSSSKNKHSTTPDFVPPPPPSPYSIPETPPRENVVSCSHDPGPRLSGSNDDSEEVPTVSDVVTDRITVVGTDFVNTNSVRLSVLKIFVFVILALETKKFALGMTMSAFFFFFLEYTWRKGLLRFLKPLIHLVGRWFRNQQGNLTPGEDFRGLNEQEGCCISDCPALFETHESNDQICEIQPVQEDTPLQDRVDLTTDKETEARNRILTQEKDSESKVSDFEPQKSRRAKIKSKLKKLVPKRFRNSNKSRSGSAEEGCSNSANEQEEVEDREENDSSSEAEEFVDAICDSGELSEERTTDTITVVKLIPTTKKKLEYMLLFMVVLIGLTLGGRIFALVSTLQWCLILKLVEKL